MTADVPFTRPRHPPAQPGDAQYVPPGLLEGRRGHPPRDTHAWRLVWIRLGGQWRPGMLTLWRHLPNGAWGCYVRWGDGATDWGWYLHDVATIRPIREPGAEPAPVPAPTVGT